MDKKAEMTMKESNNLCDMWIRDEIAYQSNKIRALKEAYDSLKNKDTDYAEGIKNPQKD